MLNPLNLLRPAPPRKGWPVVLTRTLPCPTCNARSNRRCTDMFGRTRANHHRARINAAARLHGARNVG